ncbi:MAG: alpha-N-arabinofuranosidase, partial [Lachnospiraceae bacterium]|nr:alpha-N-arabinofuranosidase [Lachnospiraceae bacterium]
ENWGCGGNMRPSHYADEYRRYQTYVRNYDGNKPIQKICCGPNVDDYAWTRGVLETCFDHTEKKFHGLMDGLSLHYYTLPETEDDWMIKGSATKFTEEIFYQTLKRGYFMEELVTKHGNIMDEFDPEKKIGLMVDEWGIWADVEPGTNPGFLYQQNTMRDALVAGMTLNIFNKHSDRVKMANIAQLINVLQSVMLTDGSKMIKTPTYYVFKMFAGHQEATLLDSSLLNNSTVGSGKNELPKVFESVSESEDGSINITLTNNSLESAEELEILLVKDGASYNVCEASVVSGAMDDHNTFEAADKVKEEKFTAYNKGADSIKVTLPKCSVVSLKLKK